MQSSEGYSHLRTVIISSHPIRMSTKWLILLLLPLLLSQQLLAQNYMVLQKGDNAKTRLRYKVGDSITYKLDDLPYYLTDVIREIQPGHLLLGENIVAPAQIESIDIRNKDERNSTLRNLTLLPAGAAILLLTAETVNSLYADGKISYSDTSLGIAAGLAVGSIVLSQVRYKKFRIKGKRKIHILTHAEWEGN